MNPAQNLDFLETRPPRDLNDPRIADVLQRSQKATWLGPVIILPIMIVLMFLIVGGNELGNIIVGATSVFSLGIFLLIQVLGFRPQRLLIADLLQNGTATKGESLGYIGWGRAKRLTVSYGAEKKKAVVGSPTPTGRLEKPIVVLTSKSNPEKVLAVFMLTSGKPLALIGTPQNQ